MDDDYEDIEYITPPNRKPTTDKKTAGGNKNPYKNERDIINVAADNNFATKQQEDNHIDYKNRLKSPLSDRPKSPGGVSRNVGIRQFGPFLGVTLCILFTELCERLTYYGISGNLLLFCTKNLNTSSAQATTIVLAFTGLSYIVPLFGGWIADSTAGKYNTIYGSALIYLVGTALLPFVTFNYELHFGYSLSKNSKYVYFALSLIFISIGTGGIKSNVSPFGAEQVQTLGHGAVRTFFNWFYWFINMGSLVSFTVIVYVQTHYGFFYGYLIPLGGMLLAICIFVGARKKYTCSPPNGSVLTDILRIIDSAFKRKWSLRELGRIPKNSPMGLLDYARTGYGGNYSDGQVNTVISLFRILPVFATMILYWTIYNQMQTSFLLQGFNMNLKLKDFVLPAASLSLFDVIIILVLIPFMDRVVYPLFKKCNVNLTSLRRIGAGMVFAMMSVIAAAILEKYRRENVDGHHSQKINGKLYNTSSITVFYQAPQYILIGASEVFTSISGLEFAYSQSPRVLQGVMMGLFLATTGLGALVGSALVNIVEKCTEHTKYGNWYKDNINEGHLDLFFYLLAILMAVNFLVFCVISMRYTYVTQDLLRHSEEEWLKAGRATPKHLASVDDDDSVYSDTYDN